MKSPIRSTSQLARELGLSRWTVSRALNGHPGLNPETVAKIKETARLAGFAPSMLGRGLRAGRTTLAGICLPDLEDYFLTTKLSLLQEALEEQGLHPIVQIVRGDKASENAALERFAAMQCSVVIVIASSLKADAPGLKNLASGLIPTLRIDPMQSKTPKSVSTDRAAAMQLAMSHLHSLGHRSLVAAGFSSESFYGKQRISGLQRGCQSLGWDYECDIRFLADPGAEDDFSTGVALGRDYLESTPRIPAILAINDRVAMGVLHCLRDKGVSVPGDVSVMGYDNSDFSPYSTPPLTTIDPRVDLLIDRTIDILKDEAPTPPTLITPELVVRESTAPPPDSRQAEKRKKTAFSVKKTAFSS